MGRDDTIYLRHILGAIARIETYTAGITREGFVANLLVQDGVIRQMEIIGEATKRLSPSFRDGHPGIPWQDMAGMRDKLIHDYFGVDIGQVWLTVVEDIPVLKTAITGLLGH